MRINQLTAITVVMALANVAGCSDGRSQSSTQSVPAPMRSTDSAGASAAAAKEDDGPKTPQQAEKAEFAALDTNSDGTLEEREWDSDKTRRLEHLKNLTFAQIDRNSSGGIEPGEFHNAQSPSKATLDVGPPPTDDTREQTDTGELDNGGP